MKNKTVKLPKANEIFFGKTGYVLADTNKKKKLFFHKTIDINELEDILFAIDLAHQEGLEFMKLQKIAGDRLSKFITKLKK
jgi:hypothetical protein